MYEGCLKFQRWNQLIYFLPFMSRYWEQTRVHPLNGSASKSTYAFGKSGRFRSESKTLCDSFYETKDYWNSKKGAGIGRGSKITFGDRNGYPSPMHYELKNKTNSKMKAVVGGKMSLGRESIKYGGIFRKSETPEPGRYETSRPTSRGYTMRAKVKELQPSYQNAPGPGAYKISSTITASGIYSLSNVTNCLCPKIKPSKQYDGSRNNKYPGPGQYNQDKENINGNGKYYVSKYESSRCRSFSRSKNEPSFIRKNTEKLPGPGSYNYFSEFGAKSRQNSRIVI